VQRLCRGEPGAILLPFFLVCAASARGGSTLRASPFYYNPPLPGYDFLVIHLRHTWQRRRFGTRRTHTVTWQSSQDQVDPPLGDIGVDLLAEDGRIGVHERMILLGRHMGG
jgi:hypothetical protein